MVNVLLFIAERILIIILTSSFIHKDALLHVLATELSMKWEHFCDFPFLTHRSLLWHIVVHGDFGRPAMIKIATAEIAQFNWLPQAVEQIGSESIKLILWQFLALETLEQNKRYLKLKEWCSSAQGG